jgi:hypothetical protein
MPACWCGEPDTILDQTLEAVVKRQIDYSQKKHSGNLE